MTGSWIIVKVSTGLEMVGDRSINDGMSKLLPGIRRLSTTSSAVTIGSWGVTEVSGTAGGGTSVAN